MFETWNFTVCSVTHSVRATWAFDGPSDTSRRISSSRRVRPGSPWVGGNIVRGGGENADRRKIEWSKTCPDRGDEVVRLRRLAAHTRDGPPRIHRRVEPIRPARVGVCGRENRDRRHDAGALRIVRA